jgi:hypothetical protein
VAMRVVVTVVGVIIYLAGRYLHLPFVNAEPRTYS